MVNKMTKITNEWMMFQKDACDENAFKAAEILKCEVTDLEWFDSEEHSETYEAIEDLINEVTEGYELNSEGKAEVNIGFQYSWMAEYKGCLGIQFCDHGLYGLIVRTKDFEISKAVKSLEEIAHKLSVLGMDELDIIDIVKSVTV
jgi:hypothetical protein